MILFTRHGSHMEVKGKKKSEVLHKKYYSETMGLHWRKIMVSILENKQVIPLL